MTKARDLGSNAQNTKPKVIDAKADLIVGTASDTADRLAVGSNGETLVADSSATTGLRWTSVGLANPVINGAFDIWQRGTSFSVAASTAQAYFADRWKSETNASQACTISRQSVGDTTNLPNIQYCIRHQRNSGQTGTGALGLISSMETANSIPFAGRTVTLSFYARAGANFSPTSGTLTYRLISGTGTDQNAYDGYTGAVNVINTTATLTTTWQRFSASGTVGATATELAQYFTWTPTGTAGAADYVEITGVQLDVGSVALPFRRAGGTLAGELAACQRYFWRFTNSTANPSYVGIGTYYSTTACYIVAQWPVPMRIAPTITNSSATGWLAQVAGTQRNSTAVAVDVVSANYADIYITTAADTAGRSAVVGLLGGASNYFEASAEL